MLLDEGLRRTPMIRLLVPVIIGIVLQYLIGLVLSFIIPAFIILFFLLCFIYLYCPINNYFSMRWLYGLILNCLILLLSMGIMEKRMQAPVLNDHTGKGGYIVARVLEVPAESEKNLRVLVEPVVIIMGDSTIKISGKAICWFPKESRSEMPKTGDRIVFPNNFREIRNSGNPFEFNYKKYLRMQGITGEIYLSGKQWFVDRNLRGGGLLRISGQIRDHLYNILKNNGISGNELSVAGALILGRREGLRRDLRQSYAESGAMHILAVSGLHVGIIYIFLHLIMGLLKKVRYYFLFSPMIILLVIWFYALLTGLSPSVTRSATMFTFIAVGRSLGRTTNIFNTLAASAFIQILLNPFALFMTGFQLSYLAVTGIIFYQPLIGSLLKLRNQVLNKVWKMAAVSISAQLLIFPLIIYYFNKFPTYFILTNLFAVPLAMIILYTGMMLFFFSFIPVMSSLLGFILDIALKSLNSLTNTVSYLPFSSISDVFVSLPVVLALYGMTISFSLFFVLKRAGFLHYAFVFILAVLALRAGHQIRTSGQQIFLIYNSGRYSVYNFIYGNNNYIISGNQDHPKLNELPYVAEKPALYLNAGNILCFYSEEFFNHFKNSPVYPFYLYGDFVEYRGSRMFFARNRPLLNKEPLTPVKVDLIVISSAYSGNIRDICKLVSPETVVLDSSVFQYRRKQLIAECVEAGLDYHDVYSSGAFINKIN